MANRSKVGKDFIKKDKEKAELRAKAKAKEKLNKSGPPSKKELVDKARNIVSKLKGRKRSPRTSVDKKTSNKINQNIGSSHASFDIGNMTDKRLGNITQKMVRPSEDKSNILYRRQKLNKDIKKEGESKQVPKSMKKGGLVSPPKKRGDIGQKVFLSKVAKQMKKSGQPFGGQKTKGKK